MRARTPIIIITLLLLMLLASYFLLRTPSSPEKLQLFMLATSSAAQGVLTEESGEQTLSSALDGYTAYRNLEYGFLLYRPQGLSPQTEMYRGHAMRSVFQGGEGEPGFQIYVAPINGTIITDERFLLDAPSGVRRDPRNASIGGIPGVVFYGYDGAVGDTYEVWFIHGGHLYEVSTYKELEEWLNDIMQTWQFVD